MLARAVRDTREAALEDRVAYMRSDAEELPFQDRSFDAVCCFAGLHLFADPLRALDRMMAVLTPGGRIAIFTSARNRSAPLRTFEGLVQARSGMYMFEREELVEALEDRGFADVRQRVAGFTQFIGGRLVV
jgi:ubiquinone/menaquinone biosynthesis C-methylase UbiE